MDINKRNHYSQIIDKHRKGNGLTIRGFADEINAYLPANFGFSHSHWYAIYRGTYHPEYYATRYLSETATGWVQDFAKEMLKALEGT